MADNLETASFDGQKWSNPKHGHGSTHGHFIKWHAFSDNEESVRQDVRRIREHPLVAPHIPIHGFIYDVTSGRLIEVPGASEAGRAPANSTQRSRPAAGQRSHLSLSPD